MKAMKKGNGYIWYVEPLDAHTNEVVAREMGAPAEDIERDLICKDGRKRNMWRCSSYDFVQKIINSKKQLNLHFCIFNRKGSFGYIREWTFFKKKQRKTNRGEKKG